MNLTERGWQENRSLAECSAHMLKTGILSDITFKVGAESFLAHRYVLTSRSPVFEAMFCGPMNDNSGAEVQIRDMEADVFRKLLNFIYTDEILGPTDSSLQLLYAAKKYMLPSLEKQCISDLESCITTESVCTILTHSLIYSHDPLKVRCLKFIRDNTEMILNSTEIFDLSYDGLCEILSMEALQTDDEMLLFQMALNWAKNHIKTTNFRNKETSTTSERTPTSPDLCEGRSATGSCDSIEPDACADADVREALGDALFLIRFPAADMERFAAMCGKSGVLTGEEKLQIYHYGLTRGGAAEREESGESAPEDDASAATVAGFPTKLRTKWEKPKIVHRFARSISGWFCSADLDAITVSVSASVLLLGVGIYGTVDGSLIESAQVDLFNQKGDNIGAVTAKNVKSTSSAEPFHLMWDTPIHMSKHTLYTLVMRMGTPARTFKGEDGNAVVVQNDVTFTFSRSPKSTNGTVETYGQIPQLLFKKEEVV